jgi:hydroxymethylbilane synthase
MMKVIVGTRGSALATTQTFSVVELLRARRPDIEFLVRTIRTEGDVKTDRPLAEIGGKGVFVKELEIALQHGDIDLAVHSLKDVPAILAEGLTLAATLRRADARDVLISRSGLPLAELKPQAVIGTGSKRREVQLRQLRPDLQIVPIRGNVDTRLRKLDEGQFDAIMLAAAGLGRLAKADRITEFLDPGRMLPSVGQGVLAIECRADSPLADIASALDDPETRVAVTAERAFLARLGAGCELPVAAYARVERGHVTLDGMLAREDGSCARSRVFGRSWVAASLGAELADVLMEEVAGVLA